MRRKATAGRDAWYTAQAADNNPRNLQTSACFTRQPYVLAYVLLGDMTTVPDCSATSFKLSTTSNGCETPEQPSPGPPRSPIILEALDQTTQSCSCDQSMRDRVSRLRGLAILRKLLPVSDAAIRALAEAIANLEPYADQALRRRLFYLIWATCVRSSEPPQTPVFHTIVPTAYPGRPRGARAPSVVVLRLAVRPVQRPPHGARGKGMGMRFGPSAAASALQSLVNGSPACGLGVCVATDSTLFQSEVFAASHPADALLRTRLEPPSRGARPRGVVVAKPETRAGDQPVLLLLGIRLDLDGMVYTCSQSVGVAGGRSSSYYFVGAQGDGLFYLDPHHWRPAVPPRPFLDDDGHSPGSQTHDTLRRSPSSEAASRGGPMESRLVHARGSSLSPDVAHRHGHGYGQGWGQALMKDEPVVLPCSGVARAASSGRGHAGGHLTSAEEAHNSRAYSVRTCGRTHWLSGPRRGGVAGFAPAGGRGALFRFERCLRAERSLQLPRTIFVIQDEPPAWPGADDDEMGLGSIFDPEDAADAGATMTMRMQSLAHRTLRPMHHIPTVLVRRMASPASAFPPIHPHSNSDSTTHSQSTMSSASARSEVDTADDPVAPITPLPGSSFDLSEGPPLPIKAAGADADLDGGGDDFVDAGGGIVSRLRLAPEPS
ncbi:hypothetical protein GGX14DRAFT_633329 [Mycena pura]|uniref:Cysteine protease n=1 Tax=Mycena pura TaxID=153505 RepID=A0AAD6VCD1_9AGAR|nr:hypothetical protein GGX14DRAFT_633329 [Mycena pura]